jgi:hypothetical protein
MPAGKKRDFPEPGTHLKCRSCEISLICISGRRRFKTRYWCTKCQGVYYESIDMVVRCVVFRQKRGRYTQEPYCPACHSNAGHHRVTVGITHKDVKAWTKT